MKFWAHEKFSEFRGQDVFLLGGGRSLKGFDFSKLAGKKVMGINDAYKLGPDLIRVCFFSDLHWWYAHEKELEAFSGEGGLVATHNPTVTHEPHPEWLKALHRLKDGLSHEGVGYGNGSGPSAVALALLLGAKNVYLLGFDGKPSETGKNNWYDERVKPNQTDVYLKFNDGFQKIANQLPEIFPESRVVNLTEGSALEMFPFETLEEVLGDE